jgi:ketosteroid isomerase-like protein
MRMPRDAGQHRCRAPATRTNTRAETGGFMTREAAERLADDWANAWNERAVDRVLDHFSEEVTFTSPTAQAVVGAATVRGKAALRDYWMTALAKIESLRFTIDRIVWDPATREMAIVYTAAINGKTRRASENLTFDEHRLVITAEVFHGVTA